MLGPNRQDDRKTLAELKKVQTTPDTYPTKKDVIEDCQVPIDNTAYADWLMEQGIPDGVYEPVDNSKPNEVCKIDSQTAFAEAMTKVEQTVPKDINVKPSSKNEDEHKQEEEKEKVETNLAFNANELVSEYVQKFQGDFKSFLATCASEEETMERITRLKDILRIMDKDKEFEKGLNNPSSETKGNEKQKEDLMPKNQPEQEGPKDIVAQLKPEEDVTKDVMPQQKQDEAKDFENKTESDASKQIENKDVNETELVDGEKEPNCEEEILQTDGADIRKIADSAKQQEGTETDKEYQEKEITSEKVDGSNSKEEKDHKQCKEEESDNESTKKKVHFKMVVTVDQDESEEKNLHIDIDDNDNELNTGMLDMGLDINSSADNDILDSNGDLVLSQMPRLNPYVHNKSTDDSTISVDSALLEKPSDQSMQLPEIEGTENTDTDVSGSAAGREDGSCETREGYDTQEK